MCYGMEHIGIRWSVLLPKKSESIIIECNQAQFPKLELIGSMHIIGKATPRHKVWRIAKESTYNGK